MLRLVASAATIGLAVGVFYPGYAGSPSDAYAHGLADLRAGNYKLAVEFFTDTIKVRPEFEPAYAARAEAEQKLKRFEKALQDVDKAQELGGNDVALWSSKAESLLHLKRYEESLTAAEKALMLEHSSRTLRNHGQALAKLGQYLKALEDYQKAIKLSPSEAELYSERALICCELEQFKRAREDCTHALSLDSTCASAYWIRSRAQRELGNKKEADEDMDKAKKLGFKSD